MPESDAPELPFLRRVFLADEPSVMVARVATGMTFYLAEPLHWARAGATQALAAFLDFAPKDSLGWWSTSMVAGWREPGRDELRTRLLPHLSNASLRQPRHGFRFRVANDFQVPSVQFDYREVNPEREARVSVLEVTLPQASSGDELLRLARAITAIGPIWSGVGGIVGRWNERHKTDGFWQIFRWARRHLGVDAQDADAAAWRAAEGLPSTNWLNYVGLPLCDARKVSREALIAGASAPDSLVKAFPDAHGALFVAGQMDCGDVNYFSFSPAYGLASRLLEQVVDPEPRSLWAGFWPEGKTLAWQRRFLEPAAWQD